MSDDYQIQYQSAAGWMTITKSDDIREATILCQQFSGILCSNVRAIEPDYESGFNVVFEMFYNEPQPPFKQQEFDFT